LIQTEFSKRLANGYFSSYNNSQIYLNFSENQPQHLKNGTNIYKIDGIYKEGKKTYKFELQIKALVQVFWSEVEHQIIYKNNYYMPDDLYVVETLKSIKNNLFGLDKMLELINTYTSTLNNSNIIENFDLNEKLIKKLIVETFNDKIMGSIRINIDIKNTRDLVTYYILNDYSKIATNNKKTYFYNIIDKFKEIKNKQIVFKHDDSLIINFKDEPLRISKEYLLEMYTKDFEWDLYFCILTNMYPQENLKTIIENTVEMFLIYFEQNINKSKDTNEFLIQIFSMGILCKDKYKELK